MNVFSLSAIVLICCIISVYFKKHFPVYSVIFMLICCIIASVLILDYAQPIFNKINFLISSSKIPSEYISIVFKCLGICTVVQLVSDSCRDAGESSLANKIEFVGKIAVAVVSLPIFESIFNVAIDLVGAK